MDEQERPDQGNSESGTGLGPQGGGSDAGRDPSGSGLEESTAQSPAVTTEDAKPEDANKEGVFHVNLPVYDGPLDLLLELIKKNEMDIYDIQVAEITKQYLAALEKMRQLDLEVAGEFLVLAATLIYIKSRMLLPTEGDDEEDEEGDPRAELVRKLIEYQTFREAARELGAFEVERGKIFTRSIADYYLSDLDPEDAQIDTFSANLYDLVSAFHKVLTAHSKETLHEVFEEVISIEEKIAFIRTAVLEQKRIYFRELFNEKWTRNELIATFLALLEVVRSKFVCFRQEEQFGEIIIERREDAPPADDFGDEQPVYNNGEVD